VIPPRPERDHAPLSFAQRRQWFLWKLDPARTAYHLSGGLVLTGPLDTGALRASLQALVERHESLRTVFREEGDGGAEQVIQQGVTVELPCIDLGTLDAAAREQAVRAEVRRIRTEHFDLARGPLMRAVLLKTGAQAHQLLVVMHHIVSDGWSVQLSLDELAAQYAARVQGPGACARGAAGAVRRLRRVAEPVAERRRGRTPARLVARPPGHGATRDLAAHRPAAQR
jgi:NRPS condensation-like uncharacterized protein